jgi:hypothetical protein
MPLEAFIIWVYCWVDENYIEILGETKIRKRGFEPALSDIEFITMEIVGLLVSLFHSIPIKGSGNISKLTGNHGFLNFLYGQVLLSKPLIYGM